MKQVAFLSFLLSCLVWPTEASAQCAFPDRVEYGTEYLSHTVDMTFSVKRASGNIFEARLELRVSGPLKNALYTYISEIGVAPDNTLMSKAFHMRSEQSNRKEMKDLIPDAGEGDPLTVALNFAEGRYGVVMPGEERHIPVVHIRDPIKEYENEPNEVAVQRVDATVERMYRERDGVSRNDSLFFISLPPGLYGDTARQVRVWLNSCGVPTIAVIDIFFGSVTFQRKN